MSEISWITVFAVAAIIGYILAAILCICRNSRRANEINAGLRAEYLAISNRIRENARKMPRSTKKHFSQGDKV